MITIGRHVAKLSGYAPAVPTPFDADDEVDGEAFARFCELQVGEGANALVVCGTTGEAPTLTSGERRMLIGIAAGVARRRVPVVAGAGSNATERAVALSRDAEAAGADAILSVVPYYNKPTQAGIEAHFRAVAAATGLPLILHDVPSRTVSALADDTIARLAELDQIIGLQDSSGDVTRPARLRPRVGARLRLLSGDDATAPAFLAQGGDGCISVVSNVAPGLCRTIYLQRRDGHSPRAQRLLPLHARLAGALSRESDASALKCALSLLGVMSPRVRLPLVEPTQATRQEIAAAIAALKECAPDHAITAAREFIAQVCAVAMGRRAVRSR